MSAAEHLATRYNAALCRSDVEWAVDKAGGVYLRDRQEWTARRTVELDRERERERRVWMANQRERDGEYISA